MTETTVANDPPARRSRRTEPGSTVSGKATRSAYVDYSFAKKTGRTLVKAGPQVTRAEANDIVADLRAAAAEATAPVAETSDLHAPHGAPAPLVVDRPGWISANVDSFRALLDPVVDKLAAKGKSSPGPTAAAIGGKVTGAEMGGLLAFLSSKVLGQYDLAPGGTPRLLLVAPNIVATERRLQVDPHDFRRWVAMHEETHRLQFTAVPWLRDHLVSESQGLAVDLAPTPEDLTRRFEHLTRNISDVFGSGEGIAQLFATPEQKARIARLTAVMSLLEGHADVVMDDVGPRVIPSVAEIRRKFDQRRTGAVGIDRILRRLLGLEAKMRQYRDGAAFVRGVTDQVGRDGFNAVWDSAESLPQPTEILDPAAWVRRVHG
ncbi:MAG: zinc-dependent metalloprotease [Terracoccus sp.]